MRDIIVRRPSDERLEKLKLGEGGGYFDQARILWDSDSGDPIPSAVQSELAASEQLDQDAKDAVVVDENQRKTDRAEIRGMLNAINNDAELKPYQKKLFRYLVRHAV